MEVAEWCVRGGVRGGGELDAHTGRVLRGESEIESVGVRVGPLGERNGYV